jgi:PAS domain S-box-containing protein
MLGLILYNGIEQRQSATKAAEDEIIRTTQQFSSDYDRVVEGTHQLLIGLAQVDSISTLSSLGECAAFLAQVRTRFPQYANLGVADQNGNVICSALPMKTAVNIGDRTYFQRAVQNRNFSTGDYQIGRITGQPQVSFGYPILRPSGGVQGIVYAALDLGWLSHLVEDNPPPAGIAVSLIDRQGTILARYPDPNQWVGKQLTDQNLLAAFQSQKAGTTEGVGIDGVQRLVGFVRLTDFADKQGISVVTSEPTALAYAAANRALVTNLIWFGVIALVAISAAWGGAYLFLLRRVNGIVQAIRRLAAGDLTARSERGYGFRELTEIDQAFDEMVEALQQQQAEIAAATDALRQSEAHYRSLVEMSPLGIYIQCDWKIVFINETGARMFGAESPDPLVGRQVLDLVHPDTREAVRERVRLLLEERRAAPLLEERLLRLDGSAVDVEVIAAPCSYNGRPAAQVILHDITERKQAEAARRRRSEEIEALYETSLALTAQLDLASLLRGISERAVRLLRAQIAGVYLLSADGQALELVAGHNLPAEDLIGVKLKIGEGASGVAAQTGSLIQVDDYQVFEKRANQYDGIPFGRVLAAPMKARGRVTGVITVTDECCTGPYTPDETRLAQLFADQAAIAVENARLYETAQRELAERERSEQTQRRLVAELSALHAVSLAGIEATDQDELTERVTRIIGERFYPDDFGIGFLDEPTGALSFHSSYRIRTGALIPSIHVGEGVTGWVALNKQPRRIGDVREEPGYLTADPEIRSEVCVPILIGDRLLGVINAESRQLEAFSQADERLLTSLAGEVGVALEKLRLLGQERRRRQEAETLRVSTSALTSTLDRGRILEQLLECLGQVVPYDSISVMLSSGGRLEIVAERGFNSSEHLALVADGRQPQHIGEVLDRGRPLIIPDTLEDPFWVPDPGGDIIRCWMGVPLVVKDRVIGVINLDKTEPGFYQTEDAQLAAAFANQAATAIDNARLYESELQRSQELAAVGKVSEALRLAPTPAEMAPIILGQVMGLLKADAAALMMFDAEAQEVRLEMGGGAWAEASGMRLDLDAAVIARVVVQSGRPYENDDVPSTPELAQNAHFKSLRAIFCVPLIIQEQVTGILEVGRRAPISEREKHLIVAIGELAANALHRAQLYEQTIQRLKRLTILRKVDMAITSSMDSTLTLNILLEEMLGGLELDAASILLLDGASNSLEWTAGRGFDPASLAHARSGLPALTGQDEDSPQMQAVLERRPVGVDDLRQAPSERIRLLAQDGFVSGMVLPLVSKGEVKGLMEVFQRSPLTRDRETVDFIESLAGQAAIALDNSDLVDNLERSNLELSLAYDATIEGWARALDLRSEETERHSYRVVEKTLDLARAMGVNDAQLVHIRRGAFLHDIGKIAVPDEIMNKAGPLTEGESEVMHKHPIHAYELLSPITYLHQAIDIPHYHHEKWDGSGYPHGLKGDEIPLAARIFAVVDVWDALSNDRPYRKAWPEEQIQAYLRDQSGRHFDPHVVDAFFGLQGWKKEE